MSAFVTSIAYEPELNDLVREYLEVGAYDKTTSTFDRECAEKGKQVPSARQFGARRGSSAAANVQIQKSLLSSFQQGQGDTFFALWEENLPEKIRNEDQVAQKLEFYLYLYFAIYPIKYGIEDEEIADSHMSAFRNYLETRGAQLSQTTEFLPFYALPYVPQPSAHPSFKELFTEHWAPDLQHRLERFLALSLDRPRTSRLFDLYQQSVVLSKSTDSGNLQQLQTQVVEAEKRTMHFMKRHNRVQTDYHNLIGITAELVDTMENTLRGTPVSVEYLQHICKRLFATQRVAASSSDVVTRPGTAAQALRQSILPSRQNTPRSHQRPISGAPVPKSDQLVAIDYDLTKSVLLNADEKKKAYLLQALRWRLTQTAPEIRNSNLNLYISNDLLGCAAASPTRNAIFGSMTDSPDSVVTEYCARLLNCVASLCKGRGYISADSDVLRTLIIALKAQTRECATRENLIGCLQKLSLRRPMQSLMIEDGMVEWLVDLLSDHDSLSDYTLEYSVALLMNLCLRGSGKRKCIKEAHKVLTTLSDLLGHDNHEILPYVNGALYSILALPEIRSAAKSMDMEDILKCFIKDDQPDMNRQIEFIIRQLNSQDEPDTAESDDEDDDDEEEADSLEPDLDKDEVLAAVPEQGEALLRLEYSRGDRRTPGLTAGAQDLLTRPVTPGRIKATGADQVQAQSRPPTRSGSRPATGTAAAEKPAELEAFNAKPLVPRTPERNAPRTPDRNAPRPTYSQQLPTSRPNSSDKPTSAGRRNGASTPKRIKTPR